MSALDLDSLLDAPWLPRRAALTPNADALSWPGGQGALTYADLMARVEEAALGLRGAGVEPGDCVAVILASGPEFTVLFHAVQRCGAVLLPLNLRLSGRELASQLEWVRPRVLVHAAGDERIAGVAKGAGVPAAVISSSADARVEIDTAHSEPSTTSLCERLDPEAPAAYLFTSGTAGAPKAAVLSLRAFTSSACASASMLGVLPDDEWLACMPLFHVAGLSILSRSVLAGTSVRIHSGFDVAAVVRDLEGGRASQISLVATMLQRLLEVRGEKRSPDRLRTLLLGGGPCAASVLERAIELGYPVAPTYGLTEACSQVATRLPSDESLPLHAGLRALPGVEVRIADESSHLHPAVAEGEVAVRGDILMSGYLERSGVVRSALRDSWFYTGDVGRLDAAGGLEILDRRDDLIISGGENIAPAEIESVLQEHPSVLEAGVVGRSDAEFGARPVAFVVLREEPGCSEVSLLDFCAERLAGYKLPAEIVIRDQLPRTVAGKLQRALLRSSL
ncbi:MAG: o-succinylbenzoate--CoA ligase [Myxococcota bacterium]|nr:o-succinylbenzoate--CoA ligase [Myxococcota bacterium]